ncbi:MAG: bifunctional chorismate mutase/prephenate dehydratase, partial [Abditibacteriota bacterium]|nr:bifunctional chorismate mutase/prephenate dehydratase [Abditibacteriota bacterium]
AHYVRFLQHTFNASKRYQRELISGVRIAYSGIGGSFASIAAERIFPEGEAVGWPGFAEAYSAVEQGDCEQAVLPLENSYAGEVGQVTDLMFQGSLYVNAVYTLRVRHCLLALPGARLSDIRRVVSHPQALAQCREYIRARGFETEEASNTAVAAEAVSSGTDVHTAAIAGIETAELYGLSVLDHDIQTSFQNATRFGVFSRVQNARSQKNSRFILMFTVRNEAGSLAKAIDVVGEYGFNMSALRSNPLKSLAWQYYFYLEAGGDIFSPRGSEMLERLRDNCDMLKIAGSYPEPEEI